MAEGEVVKQEVQYLDPLVSEKRVWNMSYLIIAFIVGLLVIAIVVFVTAHYDLSMLESVTLSSVMVAIYSIFLFFLIEPHVLRQVERRAVLTRIVEGPTIFKTIDRPVIRTVEKPVIKEVVRTVDRPVIRTIEKPVYIERKRQMPTAKHYKYVGSTLTKKYLSSRSRLARLIKKGNRVYANSPEEFERKGFSPGIHVIKNMKGNKKKVALKKYKDKKKRESKK